MRIANVVLALLFLSSVALSATIYVPDHFPTIQDAINASSIGDTVIVRAGTYYENIDFVGKNIRVVSENGPGVTAIDGGFPVDPDVGSVVTFKSGENRNAILSGFTVINGNGTLEVLSKRYGGGIYCRDSGPTIKNNHIIENDCVVLGGGIYASYSPISITNNLLARNRSGNGGGVYYRAGVGDVQIDYNRIVENTSDGDGGGVMITDCAEGTIIGNEIVRNKSRRGGGGISCIRSSPTISWNYIVRNEATEIGIYGSAGGLGVGGECDSEINGNIIMYCSAAGNGGGFVCGGIDCAPLVWNNLIINNSAKYEGGGIYVSSIYGSSRPALFLNNTICRNECERFGGGICVFGSTIPVQFHNNILWDNSAKQGDEIFIGEFGNPATLIASHCLVSGGDSSVHLRMNCTLNWGDGMIDTDPQFAAPMEDDYHLTFSSPCKSGGFQFPLTMPSEDFERNPRTVATIDIGADEYYPHLYHSGDVKPGGTINFKAIGVPGGGSTLCHGLALYDPPLLTPYGKLHIKFPLSFHNNGTFPTSGYSEKAYTLPMGLYSGQELYYQLFTGGRLWNLMTLEVE